MNTNNDIPQNDSAEANKAAGAGCISRLVRQSCNHVWREGPSCAPMKSKDALMAAIIGSKSSGRWLRGEELTWGKELEAEGKVALCCDDKAATSLPNA